MTIKEMWLERQAKKQKELDTDDAQRRFDEQKNAVLEIVDTKGFNEMVNFFTLLEKSAINLAINTEGRSADEAKIEARVCGRFLTFLENLALEGKET
jgi:hypothetical protein